MWGPSSVGDSFAAGNPRLRLIRSQQFDPVFRVQSMFMIKLYIWVSTTKWTGRQERRSWVAGSHVSQERALYCSRTNLSCRRQTDGRVDTSRSIYLIIQALLIWAAYLSTSEVWLESRGWECLLWRSSSDWTEDTCRCREAWGKKRWRYKLDSKLKLIWSKSVFSSWNIKLSGSCLQINQQENLKCNNKK